MISSGIIKLPILGVSKNAKIFGNFEGFLLIVPCLGW